MSIVLFLANVPLGLAFENEECLFCHGEPGLTKKDESERVVDLYVDAALFETSVHAPGGCVICHVDIEELPHAETLESVNCGLCHDEINEAYQRSLHGAALALGDKDVAACHDCHTKHYMRPGTDPLSPVHPLNLPETCGACHSDSSLVKYHMISIAKPSGAYLKSAHSKAIHEGRNEDAAVCNDCHGTHDLLPSQDPGSMVYHYNIPETCGQCHGDITAEYMASIHGQALTAGIKDAPTCVDCHGEHDIESPEEASSSVSLRQISKRTCPRCHDDERVMERYGVATMRQASYMDSYHGMASAAGSEVVASCTSCHGVHNILAHTDPESSTYIDNVPQTCRNCHEDAGPNFAAGPVHIMPTDPGQKALGIVRLIYIVLIVVVIGGMVLHNTIMMGRHALTKFMQEIRNGEKTYRRFSHGLTIGHLILTISFIALAVSGFALRYPETWWARHLFVGETGLAMRGGVHRVSAVVLVGLALVNFVYLVGTRGGRRELGHLRLTWKDIKDIFANLGYALGLVKHGPRFDRYSYIEKFEYWGMWWGTVLMIVTGFCMWFVDIFLHYLPKIALDVVALIHFYEAWLAVLTIVIWHLYYMIFDPETYPMNWSWITGYITMDDFKIRHPLEYEREVANRDGSGNESTSDQNTSSTLLEPEIDTTSETGKADTP